MKEKLLTFLKHFLYVSLTSAVLFFSAIYMIVIFEFRLSPLRDIFGEYVLIYSCIAVPIIIGIFSLLIKYYRKLSFKKSVLNTLIVFLAYIIITICVHFSCCLYLKSFTFEKWSEYPYQRHIMLEDLTSKHNFIGMSKEEISDILGEPSYSWQEGSKQRVGYVIQSLFLESNYFEFTIENDTVTKSRIYCDEF